MNSDNNNNNLNVSETQTTPLPYKKKVSKRKRNRYIDENERTECDDCCRLVLKMLLTHGLCEMCDEKSQNKNRMFKKLMKNVVLLTSKNKNT